MRKPSTTFNWYDLSGQTTTETSVLEVRPLFLAASSFDKGPEDMRTVYGDNFYKLYGQDISYARHGQPAVQIANIIDAGGEVLIKRIVAPDASLANLIVTATATQTRAAKVDTVTGKPIYIDADTGLETTVATSASGVPNERAYINTATIKYNALNVTDAQTLNDVLVQARTLTVEKDAGVVDGAGDSSTWVLYDGVLKDGQTVPNKPLMDPEGSMVGSAEIGSAPVQDADENGEPYAAGTSMYLLLLRKELSSFLEMQLLNIHIRCLLLQIMVEEKALRDSISHVIMKYLRMLALLCIDLIISETRTMMLSM